MTICFWLGRWPGSALVLVGDPYECFVILSNLIKHTCSSITIFSIKTTKRVFLSVYYTRTLRRVCSVGWRLHISKAKVFRRIDDSGGYHHHTANCSLRDTKTDISLLTALRRENYDVSFKFRSGQKEFSIAKITL